MKAPSLRFTPAADRFPFAGLLAFAFACASLVSLAACKGNSDAQASTSSGSAGGGAMLTGPAASVNVTADEKGFTPSSFDLKKGAPATLIFRRTSDATCATQVVFPELKITKDLPLNVPVPVEVPTGEARTLVFQCGMGMFKGKAIIH